MCVFNLAAQMHAPSNVQSSIFLVVLLLLSVCYHWTGLVFYCMIKQCGPPLAFSTLSICTNGPLLLQYRDYQYTDCNIRIVNHGNCTLVHNQSCGAQLSGPLFLEGQMPQDQSVSNQPAYMYNNSNAYYNYIPVERLIIFQLRDNSTLKLCYSTGTTTTFFFTFYFRRSYSNKENKCIVSVNSQLSALLNYRH